ncbi:MAG: RDD family protein [Planctomycetota bacterium]
MIRHGTVWVCAACKPAFLQKLREGVAVSKLESRYAGFWIRGLAQILHSIILGSFFFLLGFVAGVGLGGRLDPSLAAVLLQVLSTLVSLLYEALMIGAYGATLGKMACGIKVVTARGSPVSYGRAFGRWFGKILSGLILWIGYIMVAFDEEKRALHDRLCDTRVIYR